MEYSELARGLVENKVPTTATGMSSVAMIAEMIQSRADVLFNKEKTNEQSLKEFVSPWCLCTKSHE